ncbi:hypothetical protein E8E15_004082 [Penicillium rubens]|nr:hypothetical protein E8E15_004082 [Penicillium rubens]
MERAFTIPRCRHYEANDMNYLILNAIPGRCRYMHLELLAHIHYIALFWNSSGPPGTPELLRAVGVLRQLVRDFCAAVTEHRQGDKSQIGTVRHAQALLATPRKHRGRKTPGPLTLFRYSILIVPSHDTTPSAFQLYFTFASLSQIIPTKPRATKTIIHLNMPRSKFISLRPA